MSRPRYSALRYFIVALLMAGLWVVVLAFAGGLRPAGAPLSEHRRDLVDPRHPYDSLLRLAQAADKAFDRELWRRESGWSMDRAATAQDIAWQIAEEDLGLPGRMPDTITWADYGKDRNSVAGRYTWGDEVSLNVRYRDDPTWKHLPWLGVLIHEMVHAQGVYNETRTEILTWEVEAAMAQLDYPGARLDLLRSLRGDALIAAWWMAAYQKTSLLSDTETHRYCGSGQCPAPTGDTSHVDAVRRDLLDPVEWRRTEKRMRWWLYSSGDDYSSVIEVYVARVLGTLIPTACSVDPVVADASVAAVVVRGVPMSLPIPLPAFRVDDMAAVLEEIGGCS